MGFRVQGYKIFGLRCLRVRTQVFELRIDLGTP